MKRIYWDLRCSCCGGQKFYEDLDTEGIVKCVRCDFQTTWEEAHKAALAQISLKEDIQKSTLSYETDAYKAARRALQ